MAEPPMPANVTVPPPDDSNTLALLDPLQELCPSLEAVRELCQRPASVLPGGEAFRQARLRQAILKAASSGDEELLSYVCRLKDLSLAKSGDKHAATTSSTVDTTAFQKFNWSTLRDSDGTGPLILATSSGHVDVVRLLVRNGVEIDERDASGWTPLMWAVNNGNLPLVSFLLSNGADSGAQTHKGTTCEDFILSTTPPDSSSLAVEDDSRQIIGDIIFEHRKAHQAEQEQKQDLEEAGARMNGLRVNDNGDASSLYTPSTVPSMRGHSRTDSRSTVGHRRLIGREERTQLLESELKVRELAEGRRRALLDVAVMLQIDYQDLIGETPPPPSPQRSDCAQRRKQRISSRHKPVHSGLASGCGAVEVGSDELSNEFDFDVVRPDQMLVFGTRHVAVLIDYIVTNAKPVRAPWTVRSRPANVMFLCLRYVASLGDEDTQEELILGFINAVEESLYAHPTELTYLAYWLHNAVLLLHYVQRDATLCALESGQEYRGLLAELVNEVYIFVVRDVERRIDKMLDAAMLEHDSIPASEELKYEDQWSFIKTIRGSVKGLSGGEKSSSSSPVKDSGRRPLGQIFAAPSSPSKGEGQHRSTTSLSSSPSPYASRAAAAPQAGLSVASLLARPSPRTLTSFLTSVLHVLQLYEINPCIIVQALSQVFFWIGCELFNRFLTQKRHLCRNKAMQVRLNISALEDWIKTNALPTTLISHHFAKINQLLSWTLCQSSLQDFDGLIATLQGLRALNPLQLRHAVGEYRYEVGEARMAKECGAYLDQLQTDWERQRMDAVLAKQYRSRMASSHGRSGTATQDDPHGLRREQAGESIDGQDDTLMSSPIEDDSRDTTADARDAPAATEAERVAREMQEAIDSLFVSGRSMNDFLPRLAPTQGEHDDRDDGMASTDVRTPHRTLLINSRDMLPFALPSQAEHLVVSPGDAFGFGRGHFMGTGAASLKSMRNSTLLASSSSPLRPLSVAHSSRSTSPSKRTAARRDALPSSSSNSNSSGSRHVRQEHHPSTSADEIASVASSAATLSSTASSTLFPYGKGLAAGASWQPVPLLPDGTLETLTAAMAMATY